MGPAASPGPGCRDHGIITQLTGPGGDNHPDTETGDTWEVWNYTNPCPGEPGAKPGFHFGQVTYNPGDGVRQRDAGSCYRSGGNAGPSERHGTGKDTSTDTSPETDCRTQSKITVTLQGA